MFYEAICAPQITTWQHPQCLYRLHEKNISGVSKLILNWGEKKNCSALMN